ncbi:MAG: carbohydrate porin [Deltaproteobacteria bacterium]|nr:carbohydrate porin [Deltaproteobacteria bacterium]
MKRFAALLLAASCIMFGSNSYAEEKELTEVEKLKLRIEALEDKMRDGEQVDELGHKLHPIHSFYGLKISGGVTMVGQGVTHLKGANHRGALSLSADLAIESPVGENGTATLVFDYQRGAGLQNLPAFFLAPNANPTGPNADLESFNNDQIHVTQAYYEHNISEKLVISIGQLDLSGYIDANEYANNERSQYLANIFVNNPTIEFGGSADFVGPGIRATCSPNDFVDVTLGAFEGNGDFSDSFDSPFLMAEVNIKPNLMGRNGNYRFYYWNRQGRADVASTANPNNAWLTKAENKGVGISFDQSINDDLGVWLRAGTQRETVGQFDKTASAGFNLRGRAFNRPDDVVGFGYGITSMGGEYKDYLKSTNANFEEGSEHYMELFYNYAVDGATDVTGFHITPDIQYIMNPGGDENASKLTIYGVRLQAFF